MTVEKNVHYHMMASFGQVTDFARANFNLGKLTELVAILAGVISQNISKLQYR
jgi:SpoU rRNA methylase family enzyme